MILTPEEQIVIIKQLRKDAQKETGPFLKARQKEAIDMRQRERMFYSKWYLIPKDERTELVFEKPFIKTLSDSEFQEYLDLEFHMLESRPDRKFKRDAFNPTRSSAVVPFKPMDESGEKPLKGAHEFDSVPESYEVETLTNLGLIEKLYKFTDNKRDFLEAAKDHWFNGHFDGTRIEWSWDKFLLFLEGFYKIQIKRSENKGR